MKRAGLLLVVGGIGAAAWWAFRPSGWGAELTGLSVDSLGLLSDDTRGGRDRAGPSAAQILQDLRQREGELEAEIERERARIEGEYSRRQSQETFRGIEDRTRAECGRKWRVNFWNPYGTCDDELLRTVKAENRAWRDNQLARIVGGLEAELDGIRAEIESVALTVAG